MKKELSCLLVHMYTYTMYMYTCNKPTHEVVVPGALCWDHEETKETIGEQHLHLLIVGRQVAMRVVASVLVISSPLKAQRSQLVSSEGA